MSLKRQEETENPRRSRHLEFAGQSNEMEKAAESEPQKSAEGGFPGSLQLRTNQHERVRKPPEARERPRPTPAKGLKQTLAGAHVRPIPPADWNMGCGGIFRRILPHPQGISPLVNTGLVPPNKSQKQDPKESDYFPE